MTDQDRNSPTHDDPSSPNSPRQRAVDAYDSARDRAGEALSSASEALGTARERAGEALTTARDRAGEAIDTARDRAAEALDSAKVRASDAVNDTPLLVLGAGIAVGAVLAALLPRTRTEDQLVKPTADRVKDSARAALSAARETGSQKFSALGDSNREAGGGIGGLVDGLADLARSSATAAVDAVRNKR